MTGSETTNETQSDLFETEQEGFDEPLERGDPTSKLVEELGSLLDITVSDDGLAAYLSAREALPPHVEAAHVRKLLQTKGIVHGIVDEAAIMEYLSSAAGEPLKIAEGRAPTEGKEAEIQYYFDTDPLKIGRIKEGGVMDYRDRGDIPQVRKGDLLAEKIPGILGSPGTTVHNKIVPPSVPKDVKLRCGRGIEKSEDSLKAFAKVDGRPDISPRGEVTVAPVLRIPGDVDLKIGHIDFEGYVEVVGAIEEGFRVKATGLRVKEIFKSEVNISGDIFVVGGVIGSTVRSRGNIRAKYIHDSHVEAMADLRIDKEIRDSEIDVSGTCIVEKGKILSSVVSARKGIQAQEIGSGSSRPCRLCVGIDSHARREEESIKQEIEEAAKERMRRESQLARLREDAEVLNRQVGELAQVQDRTMVQMDMIEELKRTGDAERLPKAYEAYDFLEAKIRANETKLDKMLDDQERLAEEIKDSQLELDALAHEREELLKDLDHLSKEEKIVPIVKVPGVIFNGTSIKGPHASGVLRENYRGVLIREVQTTSPTPEAKWKMSISPFRP